MDSRADVFTTWLEDHDITPQHIATWNSQTAQGILGAYLDDVADGTYVCKSNKPKGEAFVTKALNGYLDAAFACLETLCDNKLCIKNPDGKSYVPILAQHMKDTNAWTVPKEEREPFTYDMLSTLERQVQEENKSDSRFFLSLKGAVFDWIRLGVFTGSRSAEYAQTKANRHEYIKVPTALAAGKWADTPIAFIADDFKFYTKNRVLIPHNELRRRQQEVDMLQIRYRYDKSPRNFAFRKYGRTGHAFLCPILVALSIITRAHYYNIPPLEPIGVHSYSSPRSS